MCVFNDVLDLVVFNLVNEVVLVIWDEDDNEEEDNFLAFAKVKAE
jgi:hypothetical protein